MRSIKQSSLPRVIPETKIVILRANSCRLLSHKKKPGPIALTRHEANHRNLVLSSTCAERLWKQTTFRNFEREVLGDRVLKEGPPVGAPCHAARRALDVLDTCRSTPLGYRWKAWWVLGPSAMHKIDITWRFSA